MNSVKERVALHRATQRSVRNAMPREQLAPPPPLPTGAEAAEIIVKWAADKLVIPSGPLTGQPFILQGWQQEWLAGALADGIQEAGLSVARKNGKTGLVAVAVLAHLVGPLHRPGWTAVCISYDSDLALELRAAAVQTAEASRLYGWRLEKSPRPGRIHGRQRTECRFLAADRSSGHAIGADLAIVDEAGLLLERQRDLWESVHGALAARGGRLWAISIQGTSPMFAEMESRADDPTVHWQRYQASEQAALDDPTEWANANPGLGSLKSRDYMAGQASKAMQIPANESYFRSQHLNQTISPSREPIVTVAQWQACLQHAPLFDDRNEEEVIIGIDLGGAKSMSSAALLHPVSGKLDLYAALPGIPDPVTRGQADRVGTRYYEWVRHGAVWLDHGKRLVDIPAFLDRIRSTLPPDIKVWAVADQFRRAEMTQALADAGLTWSITWTGSPGTRSREAVHDLRSFQSWVARGKLRPRHNAELLEWAISESHIVHTNGQPTLVKARELSRIDALQAAVLATGLAEQSRHITSQYGGSLEETAA